MPQSAMSSSSSTIGLALVMVAALSVASATYTPYFGAVNTVLKGPNGFGEGIIWADLDLVDANIAAVRQFVPDPSTVRVVTKSLPCPDLLAHIMAGVGTNRMMVFSASMLSSLLVNPKFGGDVDYLWGIPLSPQAANRFFDSMLNVQHVPPQTLVSPIPWCRVVVCAVIWCAASRS
jgi:hypothetical protein